MLKKLEYDYMYIDAPAIVHTDNGVTIRIEADKSVTIEGHTGINMKCNGNIDLDAKNISLQAQENVYIGSGKTLIQQAPTIHLNPEHDNSGYKK